MLYEINTDTEVALYNYFVSSRRSVPYYFSASFENWRKSMFADTDYDGKPLFSDLKTYLLINGDNIKGFVQFGLTNFIFDEQGKKDCQKQYGVIRNIHFKENAEKEYMLLDKATEYFDGLAIEKRYAFFHYFGMSCYARQGKLHSSEFYMEELMHKYGYVKEHENVYFSKSLQDLQIPVACDIDFISDKNGQDISFIMNNEKIGGCELCYVPFSDICFLKWVYIDSKYSHKGLGTKCMNKLFYELQQKGFSRFDTDTIDSNTNAQGYYLKTGFTDMGRMRSYHIN